MQTPTCAQQRGGLPSALLSRSRQRSGQQKPSVQQPLPCRLPTQPAGTGALSSSGRQRGGCCPCPAVSLPEAVTAGLFAASTIYTGALALLMVLAPRWQRTQQLMRQVGILLPLAAVYGFLLACSWESDTFSLILPGSWEEGFKGGFNPQFFPELSGIMALFSRLTTAASLWVHLQAINLFAARTVYLQGLELGIPTWHSILLCVTLSPLGLLSHVITKRVSRRGVAASPVAAQ